MRGRIAYDLCPLCGGPHEEIKRARCDTHSLYSGVIDPEMVWMECDWCGHVYTEGYFTPDVSEVILSRNHDIRSFGTAEEQRLRWAEIVEKVARLRHSSGRWLDVGFGLPSLMMTAEEWGFATAGVDLREEAVKRAKDVGCQAIHGDITTIDSTLKFDVISLCDVLEHTPFPRDVLKAAGERMEIGGLLVLSMPAYDSPIWRVLDQAGQNPYWMEIEHFHNFSRERLYSLLQQEGFSPAHYDVSKRYRACMEVIAIRTRRHD